MRFTRKIKTLSIVAMCVTAGLGSVTSLSLAAQDEGAKANRTIKEVMKLAHGKDSNLLKKVLSGEASAEEKSKLLDLYISLVEAEPSKGELDSWHTLAGGAALAAAKVVVGREGAVKELETATNCKACHSVHKGN